jgi:hypothetical protein
MQVRRSRLSMVYARVRRGFEQSTEDRRAAAVARQSLTGRFFRLSCEATLGSTQRCFDALRNPKRNRSERLRNNSGSITEYLCRAHHGPGVIPDTDNAIGTQSARMRNHQLKGLLARRLAKIRKNSNTPAKKCPESTQDAQR